MSQAGISDGSNEGGGNVKFSTICNAFYQGGPPHSTLVQHAGSGYRPTFNSLCPGKPTSNQHLNGMLPAGQHQYTPVPQHTNAVDNKIQDEMLAFQGIHHQYVSGTNCSNTVVPNNIKQQYHQLVQHDHPMQYCSQMDSNMIPNSNACYGQTSVMMQVNTSNFCQPSVYNDHADGYGSTCSSAGQSVPIVNQAAARSSSVSRCDSVRSETAESSCSSMSSDSHSEFSVQHVHISHHNESNNAVNSKNTHKLKDSNVTSHLNAEQQQCYKKSDFKDSLSDQNKIIFENKPKTLQSVIVHDQSNFVHQPCNKFNNNQSTDQPQITNCQVNNPVPPNTDGSNDKQSTKGPNVVQAFQEVNAVQHVQMQGGQFQIMQHYQYVQGQNFNVVHCQGVNLNSTTGNQEPLGVGPQNVMHCQSSNRAYPPGMHVIPKQNFMPVQQNIAHGGSCASMPQGQNVGMVNVQPVYSNAQFYDMREGAHSQNSNQYPQVMVMNSGGSQYGMSGIQGRMPIVQNQAVPRFHMANVCPDNSYMNQLPSGNPMCGFIHGCPIDPKMFVVVPFGWRRLICNGHVVYISPSGNEMRSLIEVSKYLTTEGTCKCGLQCPLRVENVFNFDPKVPSRPTMPNELEDPARTPRSCQHRRKLAIAFTQHLQSQAKKEDAIKNRKRRSSETSNFSTPSPQPMQSFSAQQQLHSQNYLHQQGWNANGCHPRFMIPPQISSFQNNSSCNTYSPNQGMQASCCDNHTRYGTSFPVPAFNSNIPDNVGQLRPQLPSVYPPVQRHGVCRPAVDPSMYKNPSSSPGINQMSPGMMNSNAGFTRVPFVNNMVCRTGNPGMMVYNNVQQPPVSSCSTDTSSAWEGGEKRKKQSSRSRKRLKTCDEKPNCFSVKGTKVEDDSASNCNDVQNSTANVPSFMEDPSGYLAQQTALLNNTMAGGGQFSPQTPGLSPRPSQGSQSVVPNNCQVGGSASNNRPSLNRNGMASSSVVPLPSNVPLPAKVSKGAVTTTTTAASSVQQSSLLYSSSKSNTNSKMYANIQTKYIENLQCSDDYSSDVSESSTSKDSFEIVNTCSNTSASVSSVTKEDTDVSVFEKNNCAGSGVNKENKKMCAVDTYSHLPKIETLKCETKLQNNIVKDSVLETQVADTTSNSSNSNVLYDEFSNKPLTPGPYVGSCNTQSPLEMVQNIVSSIPVPSTSASNSTGKIVIHSQNQSSYSSRQGNEVAGLNTQIYGVNSGGSISGVVCGTSWPNSAPGIVRGTTPVLVHGSNPPATTQQPMLVNSNNMVVVSSAPFNAKGLNCAAVVTTGVTGMAGVVSVQGVPQVQVQSSLTPINSAHIQPQLQQIQPVVQLVNTFATMQAPVIIQNGGSLIQPSGVIQGSNSIVTGPAGILPSSATFVANQAVVSAPGTFSVEQQQNQSQLQVAQVVTTGSVNLSENCEHLSNCTTSANSVVTPCTPQSTAGSNSDTPSSGGSNSSSANGGKRRKRRRNGSTPQGCSSQNSQTQQPPNLMPAIIMGNKIPQQMIMNGSHMTHVPYAGAHVTHMTAVSTNSATPAANQLIHTTHPTVSAGAINVVQMVSGPVAGPLPMQVQPQPTILLPSAAPSGVIINQLSDGTFISTDPSNGMSYPVQLQISGSQIVGVTPTSGNAQNTNVSLAPNSNQPNTLLTLRHSVPSQASIVNGTKVVVSPCCVNSSVIQQHAYSESSESFVPNQQVLLHQPNDLLKDIAVSETNIEQRPFDSMQICIETRASVSTQTVGTGESDVSSSDNVGGSLECVAPILSSPTHQSSEVTTTRQDEESISPQQSSPSSSSDLISSKHQNSINSGVYERQHTVTAQSWW